jgi:hypothetical protein
MQVTALNAHRKVLKTGFATNSRLLLLKMNDEDKATFFLCNARPLPARLVLGLEI